MNIKHTTDIDTHYFKLELETLQDVRDLLVYIKDNIDGYNITSYDDKERTISTSTLPDSFYVIRSM